MTPRKYRDLKNAIIAKLQAGDPVGANAAFWEAAEVLTDDQVSAMMQLIAIETMA